MAPAPATATAAAIAAPAAAAVVAALVCAVPAGAATNTSRVPRGPPGPGWQSRSRLSCDAYASLESADSDSTRALTLLSKLEYGSFTSSAALILSVPAPCLAIL